MVGVVQIERPSTTTHNSFSRFWWLPALLDDSVEGLCESMHTQLKYGKVCTMSTIFCLIHVAKYYIQNVMLLSTPISVKLLIH